MFRDEHETKNKGKPGFYPALFAVGDGLKMLPLAGSQKAHSKVSSKASSPKITLLCLEQQVTLAALRASSSTGQARRTHSPHCAPPPLENVHECLHSCTHIRVHTLTHTHTLTTIRNCYSLGGGLFTSLEQSQQVLPEQSRASM